MYHNNWWKNHLSLFTWIYDIKIVEVCNQHCSSLSFCIIVFCKNNKVVVYINSIACSYYLTSFFCCIYCNNYMILF